MIRGALPAVVVVLMLALPMAAGAWTVAENITLGQALLPVDHPCKATATAEWVAGLLDDGGQPAGAAANIGHRDQTGQWLPMSCVVSINPVSWAAWDACQQRRAILHEFGHLTGRTHADGGIMSPDRAVQDTVAVPGCPAILPPLRERVTTRVLELVPDGWAVACHARKNLVMRCRADDGRRAAWYRARAWDLAWSGFTVVRAR